MIKPRRCKCMKCVYCIHRNNYEVNREKVLKRNHKRQALTRKMNKRILSMKPEQLLMEVGYYGD